MKKAELALTPDKIAVIRSRTTNYDRDRFDLGDKAQRQTLKFVREGDRFILFPKTDPDNFMHIDYAIAAGMQSPDDAGQITVDLTKRSFILIDDSSLSLYVPPRNNTERPPTIEKLRDQLPQGFTLEVEKG